MLFITEWLFFVNNVQSWENNWFVSDPCWTAGWSGNLEDLNIDSESGISFASIGSDSFTKMVKMSMVSNPVVTAVEKNCIWFVSH